MPCFGPRRAALPGSRRSARSSSPGTCIRPDFGKEQLHSISQLHESFARNLTSAAGAYLRDKFEVALVAVEQLAYRDFLARFSDVTYYGTFRLPPGEASGILHLDLSLAFPVVDLLLGGLGQMPKAKREVTDIEENVLEGVGEVICRELQLVWSRWVCKWNSSAGNRGRRCCASCRRKRKP